MRKGPSIILLLASAGLLVGSGVMLTKTAVYGENIKKVEESIEHVRIMLKGGDASGTPDTIPPMSGGVSASPPDLDDLDIASDGFNWPDTPPDASNEQRVLDKRWLLSEAERRAERERREHELKMKKEELEKELEKAKWEFWKSVITTCVPAMLGFIGTVVGFRSRPR